MAKKGFKVGLDPVKIYRHASAFHKAYDVLLKAALPKEGAIPDDQFIGIIAHPAMVLSLFASELYLKCLLCVETGEVPEGHNLKTLFLGLPVPTRHALDGLWDTDMRRMEKQKALEKLQEMDTKKRLRLDLRYALDLGADSFIKLRYFYEKEEVFCLLSDFPFVLRNFILDRFPSWGSILPKASKGLIH